MPHKKARRRQPEMLCKIQW